jgi:site-specific recombinase XerD
MQKQNETDFQRFHDERRANEIKEVTMKAYLLTLSRLDAFLKKSFREASKDDIMAFFTMLQNQLKPSTVHTWKTRVKTFYNWLFELAPREYPDCVKWVRVSNPRSLSKTKGYVFSLKPEDVLSREDILKLIEACDHPRDQALIMTMYETSCEPSEALNMKVKSVMFDQQGAVVSLEGGTGVRRIRVVDSVPYLQAWLNVHPFRKSEESPLWLVRRRPNERLGYWGLWTLLKTLKRRSGIKKPLRPNFLRHAGLTRMAKFLPEQKFKVYAGWTPDSRMAAIYVHLAGKDLDDDILRLHGKTVVEEKEPLKSPLSPRVCPRCQHESPATYLWCGFCGQRLDVELDETNRIERDRFLKWLAEEAMKDREILKRWYAASDRVDKREKKASREK